MEKDLISVVLPTYNGDKYICESINSILNQTYTNWELIIVDDGSTDSTLQIAYGYAKKDQRIKIIHNEKNSKLPQALNIGFSMTRGELLTWTSDDNRFLPSAFDMMQRYLSDNKVQMVCANMYGIDVNGIQKKVYKFSDDDNLCVENIIGACFMYTRDVYECIGEYDTDMFCVEDYDYWIRVERMFGKIIHIPNILYEYRIHDESLTMKKREYVNRQVLKFRYKHMQYILRSLKDDKKALYQLYMDSLNRGCDPDFLSNIVKYLPELQYEVGVGLNEKKFVIFGAGVYGEKAWSVLQGQALCFVDNERNKAGNVKNGLRVIDFEELIQRKDDYYIMVAVSSQYSYQIVKQLSDNGFTNYCTYQYYVWRNKYGIYEQRTINNCGNK